jgi:hypothetical protein
LPDTNQALETEITKETKKKPDVLGIHRFAQCYWAESQREALKPELEATLLGKVNAIAEHLGVEFKVSPEHVVAEKVKAVKKATVKKTVVAKKTKK